MAIFSKWVAALFTQLILRYSKLQRQLIFGLSSSHAAATLAIILVGYRANIIDDNILNGTIILILITCIVASFVTERAAKQLVVQSDAAEVNVEKIASAKSEHILLPIEDVANF